MNLVYHLVWCKFLRTLQWLALLVSILNNTNYHWVGTESVKFVKVFNELKHAQLVKNGQWLTRLADHLHKLSVDNNNIKWKSLNNNTFISYHQNIPLFTKREKSLIFSALKKTCFLKLTLLQNFQIQCL